jgi:pimeloyl-ACP methyl ester carboxylesterase
MTPQIKNVVLVHGAFADGSGWAPVARILKNNGYKVSVPQPPETSYADDQKYTKATIDAMGSPVVLVGHSYGGSIITAASNHPNVAALVYFAAFALDEGESCASIEQALPQASKAFKPDSNGDWWIDEAQFAADFAADIPREEAEFMAISQVPISTDCFTHQVRKLQSGDAAAAKCSPVSSRSAVQVRRPRLSAFPRRSVFPAIRRARCGRRRSVRAPQR